MQADVKESFVLPNIELEVTKSTEYTTENISDFYYAMLVYITG